MPLRPTLLLVPSFAAAVEWPRRLASTGRAVAGLLPFRLIDLARAVAEPVLLGGGSRMWDSGLSALLAARHLEERPSLRLEASAPRGPVAAALARSLSGLRAMALPPHALEAFAAVAGRTLEDATRLRAVAHLYRRFDEDLHGFLDPVALYREARRIVGETAWLRGASVLLVEPLDVRGHARLFLEAVSQVASVRLLDRDGFDVPGGPPFDRVRFRDTPFAPLEPPPVPPGLERVAKRVFEAATAEAPVPDSSVELLTAASEAAEARAIARRCLRAAAAGVPFEEMGVLLPRAEDYAPLFSDLFEHLGIPYRLHPSLPLRFGRVARSLLLLFRCRALERSAVMEFLTFVPRKDAPAPQEASPADEGETADFSRTAQWDFISREAGIVSGRDRFEIGLTWYAEEQRREAAILTDEDARARREARAKDAEDLKAVVARLADTLDELRGEAPWEEWSRRLLLLLDEWIGEERDREAVREVLQDLAGLRFAAPGARWDEVESVIEARFEWERLPMAPAPGGAIHVGVFDALAGVPFRLVAIPGLVEGGYPGVVRPDPFLLDAEREALSRASASPKRSSRSAARQMALFGGDATPALLDPLPTAQDRLIEARRAFRRAVGQATESLILSYPRADARTGRERLPSLFFVAAASAREGRPLSAAELSRLVVEDDIDKLALEDTLDASERDRSRMRRGEPEVAAAIGAACPHFARSRHASRRRWSGEFTVYDGLLHPLPPDLRLKLDPTTAPSPISASRLSMYSRCGFQYMLQNVLRLRPTEEPEERLSLSPLERGDLFHRVAERFLREERDQGRLPVHDDAETRRRLFAHADGELAALVAKSPPRFTALWERECSAFRGLLREWLRREAGPRSPTTPLHLEVGFGPGVRGTAGELHLDEPVAIDLKDGRALRVAGKIDRIDRCPDGTLVLRDYKTGRAPKDDGRVFRGGPQLQIAFYVLAAAKLLPRDRVSRAFLDYVNGGREVALDLSVVQSDGFPALLRGLVDAIAEGLFPQEPTACATCDFTAVCGPKPFLELRRLYKSKDPRLQRGLRARDVR